MCGCVSPTALLALRMPRRPTSQELTTATRAQPNGSGLCSSSSSGATAAAAAAIQQNTHSPSGSSNSNKQQKQNETKKKSKEKNCHANDSRLQRAIVYRVCVLLLLLFLLPAHYHLFTLLFIACSLARTPSERSYIAG